MPFGDPDPVAAQQRSDVRRQRQAETAARVVDARTRPNSPFVILGDMNDAPDAATLEPMITQLRLIDALRDLAESRPSPRLTNPEDEPDTVRWTHRHSVTRAPDAFELIDQIWVSPALEPKVEKARIERRIAWTAAAAGVGSDHDRVWVRLLDL